MNEPANRPYWAGSALPSDANIVELPAPGETSNKDDGNGDGGEDVNGPAAKAPEPAEEEASAAKDADGGGSSEPMTEPPASPRRGWWQRITE